MPEITEGSKAPAFDMATDNEGRARLSDFAGKTVVLYFYPKADTPGCTTEGQDFSALFDEFAAANAVVIGVSRDAVKKLERFRAKHDLKVILGSDEDGTVCEAFGTWVQKQLYGREYMGVERATFVIDGQGTIRQIWHKVKVKAHAMAVLEVVRTLQGV
ncbi:MAG: peroxiredoxin Q/BCP [Brevundimonas sp.]|jgi:peroxiredoxin Q/BCP|uniref:thioredoxin-dependent thiol peroxidase n=1 Tax=Brevundimonas sp. TaxID=1871086 RepID=UPI002487A7C7|nr:thioredoxin-dependent thiol peroxidase [Brevundimonas sp.]MDI1282069.1 thioredoxin-dependent thiol peroxidase [Brevundimonas sp.]